MLYYSTNRKSPEVTLKEAVIQGLAPDRGLYMPKTLKRLPDAFFHNISGMSLQEISFVVAESLFSEDVKADVLKNIVYEALNFEIPLVKVKDNIYCLELFHGPTLAFKDVGARFMARLLGYFVANEGRLEAEVLAATSGDTGSAVANGFLDVPGVNVYVLYPKGKVTELQEKQFTTLGRNITALEVDGVFDDCQTLVKNAFVDDELRSQMNLTSANSINLARLLPQVFYYFHAYAQLAAQGITDNIVVSVPSGNFGNITAGLIAKRMGLPIKRFIAANNKNDIFFNYLKTGVYTPAPSVSTVANAMDVGDPSNFVRLLELCDHSHAQVCAEFSGCSYSDNEIKETIKNTFEQEGYILDPHGACGYRACLDGLQAGETAIFLETAHPAKFKETVEDVLKRPIEIPATLQAFMKGEKKSIPLFYDYNLFKKYLLSRKK